MYKFKKRKGQSTVEYILLVTAVIIILLVFLTGTNSPFQKRVNETLQQATDGMVNMANRLRNSRPAT